MRIRAVAFSANGCSTALKLKESLDEDVELFCKTSSDTMGIRRVEGPMKEWVKAAFTECDAIVFIGALGIAVRYIAPFIKSKTTDPAVVVMDEHARWTIALLSGHIGGCNELTERIAERMGSEAVVTTATDLNGKFSVDTFAERNGMRISSMKVAKDVSARVLDGRFVGFCSDIPISGELPEGIVLADDGAFGVCVSADPGKKPFDTTLNLVPMDIILGIGCRRDTDPDKMESFIEWTLRENGIARERVLAIASIDLKKDEQAILRLAKKLEAQALFYTADELNSVKGEFSKSDFVTKITAVDCVCERSAVKAGGERFIKRKTAEDGMTVAICSRDVGARFL